MAHCAYSYSLDIFHANTLPSSDVTRAYHALRLFVDKTTLPTTTNANMMGLNWKRPTAWLALPKHRVRVLSTGLAMLEILVTADPFCNPIH